MSQETQDNGRRQEKTYCHGKPAKLRYTEFTGISFNILFTENCFDFGMVWDGREGFKNPSK